MSVTTEKAVQLLESGECVIRRPKSYEYTDRWAVICVYTGHSKGSVEYAGDVRTLASGLTSKAFYATEDDPCPHRRHWGTEVGLKRFGQMCKEHKNEGSVESDQKTVELTNEEFQLVVEALRSAGSDIWQLVRVAERNLTGKDITFPDDAPVDPSPPKLVTREGIEQSMKVHDKVKETLKMLANKNRSLI